MSKTINEPMSPYCADGEHYWSWQHIPDYPLNMRVCMTCGKYDGKAMNKELFMYVQARESEAWQDGKREGMGLKGLEEETGDSMTTPFDERLDKILKHYQLDVISQYDEGQVLSHGNDKARAKAKAALTQLHKAAIVAELEAVQAIPSEVGKLSNHSLRVSEYLADRIEQYKKEETRE